MGMAASSMNPEELAEKIRQIANRKRMPDVSVPEFQARKRLLAQQAAVLAKKRPRRVEPKAEERTA